ncbi:hypothetical protein J4231_01770 [Candidatus Woesearchaeota archaeon]|nr:hypothetical protein [Candidatus Woesearchaeota archaeon]
MPKQRTLQEAYNEYESKGEFKDQEAANKEKIKLMIEISKANLDSADLLKKNLETRSLQWCVIYKLYYDSLRELADALVLLDNKKILNHQGLFAYLCTKHPELDLDWNFFEKVRTKRNGINYYGTFVTANEFREIELQTELYIKALEKAVKEKLIKN